METTIVINSEITIILEYIFKKTSWRELFFRRFSIGQKFLFFLPVPFLYLSIYGAYDLFHNNSWVLFILFGLITLLSIWIFFKTKSILEKKVFNKFYLSETCKTILDYHIDNIARLLGEQNTLENRVLWKDYFKNKPNVFPFFIFIPIFGFMFFYNTSMFFYNTLRPHDKYYLEFHFGWFTLIILLMTFAFIMPAIKNFKFKRTAHNEAYKLILEMDNKLTKI